MAAEGFEWVVFPLTRTYSESLMVLKMDDKELIRRLVNIQGISQREVNRRFGWSRDSIADAVKNSEPNTYSLQAPRPRPITDPIVPLVMQWLDVTDGLD